MLKPPRLIVAGFAAVVVIAALVFAIRVRVPSTPSAHPPPKYREAERKQAISRGLSYIIQIAHEPEVFNEYGADLLWCLYSIGSTSSDPELSRIAWEAARERVLEYRRLHRSVPANDTADEIAMLVHGNYTADLIGPRDDAMKEQIRKAAARFSRLDFLWYDPSKEPPPSDVPDECDRCGRQNSRGVKFCKKCGAKLTMQSRYDIWLDSLIAAFAGDRYGVELGGSFADVIRWAPVMHPYRPRAGNPEFIKMVYAATHVVYTLNDYSKAQISPRCLPDEFNFLKATLTEAIALQDPETMGEFLDSLRALGMTDSDPLIRSGMDYVLRTQNQNGSWGDTTGDSYSRYHSTWTAVDGLREYRWKEVLCPAIPPVPPSFTQR